MTDLVLRSLTAVNFIDVGANEGKWSERFISRMRTEPVGVLFEPMLRSLQVLRQNFFLFPRVQIVDRAISDHSGEAIFCENITRPVLSSLIQADAQDDASDQVEPRRVAVTTLDHELEVLGWQKCTFVKIDAEGENYYCLCGARWLLAKKRMDFIQFEGAGWHGVTMLEAAEFLADHGYKTYQLHPNGLRAIDIAYFGDSGSGNWLVFHANSPEAARILKSFARGASPSR